MAFNFFQFILVVFCNSDHIFKSTKGCLDDNKTYVINIHTNIQNEIRDAITSLASKLNSDVLADEIQGISGEKASITATRSYLGTTIEELNKDLEIFNIQVNLVFENQEIDQISANGAYDPSCEITSPVKERVTNTLSSLISKFTNNIGVHLYIFGCVYVNRDFDLVYISHNSNCGRIIGVMWDGSVNTKVLIKSAIMEALTDVKDAYASGSLKVHDKNVLCGFFEKCIGLAPTIHGQLLNFRKFIHYTRDESSESHRGIEKI